MKTKVQGKSAVLLKMQSLGTLVGESAFRPMTGESKKPLLVSPRELGITFIGHSSFLIQIGGRKLLMDPVFAERLIALRRLRRPGVKIKDLPAIDLVFLSHAHMDHLNRPSLRRIVAHNTKVAGRAPIAVVPWGVEDLVSDLGFARVVTLEWWQTKSISGLEITMTPCKHWGARFFKDTHRGFGGYVIRGAATHSITQAIPRISMVLPRLANGLSRKSHCCPLGLTGLTAIAGCTPALRKRCRLFSIWVRGG